MTTPQFISVEEARAAILDALTTLGAERVLLNDAPGRYVAEVVIGPFDSPAFDNSAMDGFAFQHTSAARMKLVGESAAGVPFAGEVRPGEAVRIMTGAAVPAGCDTVAMREACEVDADHVTVSLEEVEAGSHIRKQGTFMKAGEPVIEAGTLLRPADVGLLASFGRTVVSVTRAARVGILTTGTELVEPDREPGPGQIYNSNAYMLEALVREAGGVPFVAPIVVDDEEATRRAILDLAASSDLVITVGGVSVGDYDYVQQILEEQSGGMAFWKVRMKPGKPLAFGTLRSSKTPVIGLPGNPVSSFVGFHQFVRPALRLLHGGSGSGLRAMRLPATSEIRSTPRRREYVLGHLVDRDGVTWFEPHRNLSSGNVLSMHGCDALGVVEEGVEYVERGAELRVEIL